MNDILKSDLFSNIDPSFIEKIDSTINNINGKSDIEVIGTFMALSNEATQRGISMSSEQQKALILFLRDSLPSEKRQKFDLIISMMGG